MRRIQTDECLKQTFSDCGSRNYFHMTNKLSSEIELNYFRVENSLRTNFNRKYSMEFCSSVQDTRQTLSAKAIYTLLSTQFFLITYCEVGFSLTVGIKKKTKFFQYYLPTPTRFKLSNEIENKRARLSYSTNNISIYC